jgi:hypothetical protein
LTGKPFLSDAVVGQRRSGGRAAVLQSNGVQRYPSAQPDRGGRGLRSLNIELQNALNRPGEVGIEPVDLLR